MSIEHARELRSQRAGVLRELGAGKLKVREIIAGNPSPGCIDTLDVYDILLRAKGLGRDTCRVMFERAGVWPHTRLLDLTPAQRERLLDELPARVA